MDLKGHTPHGQRELGSVFQPKVSELDLAPTRPGGPGCTGGQCPGRLGQEGTLDQRSLLLDFLFCKMGIYCYFTGLLWGTESTKAKNSICIVKIMTVLATLYLCKVLLLLASASCQPSGGGPSPLSL